MQERFGGYATFEPAPLPPKPALALDGATYAALSRADRAIGILYGQVAARPRAAAIAGMACRREAVASCRLDGSPVTLRDLLWWELDGLRADRLSASAGEVTLCANYAAILQETVTADGGATPGRRWLCEAHRRLFRGLRGRDDRPGRLRSTEIWLGPPGSTARAAAFVPPAPQAIAEHLDQLEAFLDGPAELPPLAKVALAFYQLETVHPFVDGNGRVCRLALMALLHEASGPPASPCIFCPSTMLAEGFAEHFRWLQRVRAEGDWEGWVRHFAVSLALAAEVEVARLGRTDELLREHEERIAYELPNLRHSAHILLARLVARPLTSVNDVAGLCRRTFANANLLVGKLEALGLLAEITGRKRHRRYVYTPYVDLV